MPRKSYTPSQRAQVRQALVKAAVRAIAEGRLLHTSVDQISQEAGVSKTFFYTFFPSKEDLVLEALCCQQPGLLRRARALMADTDRPWQEGVRRFLEECCDGRHSGVAVLSLEEEQAVYHCLSAERFASFRQKQLAFFTEALEVFGIPAGRVDPMLFGNTALAMMMVRRAIPEQMPFLFPEAADAMVRFQIDALVAALEAARSEDAPRKEIPHDTDA